MALPPPGLFSTTTGTPKILERGCVTMRETRSLPLPGPWGLMSRMGLLGNCSAPLTVPKHQSRNKKPTRINKLTLILVLVIFPSFYIYLVRSIKGMLILFLKTVNKKMCYVDVLKKNPQDMKFFLKPSGG